MFRFVFLLGLVCAPSVDVEAKQIRLSPRDDWFTVITGDQLRPGDELVLDEGVYSDPRRLAIRMRGDRDNPIVIRAATGQSVLFRRPDAKQNTLNLEGCQHLILRGIEITGGAAGIRIEADKRNQSSHIVLEEMHIHHIGGVAVTCNQERAVYREMVFRRNHIHHTSGHGEAFYLGANHGAATLANSIVQDNYIHHLNGPSVSQGDGIEIKQGSFGNLISGNVIHDTNYPAITVYAAAGKKRNVITNNLIWSTGDHGIQSAADAIVRGNCIANAVGCGIYSREHQGAIPGNLRIEKNFVVANNNPAIRVIGNRSKSRSIEIIGNTLLRSSDEIVVRLENLQSIVASDNRVRGTIDGPSELKQSWSQTSSAIDQASKIQRPSLTLRDNHPARAFLAQTDLESVFETQ